MGKIGLGIITCNREEFYTKCYSSIPQNKIDSLITVNDGKQYDKPPPAGAYIHHEQNKGVGVSKNVAMQWLLEAGCDHIFLIEDDILIKNDQVFEKYIELANESGVYHLMFGYHGPANKGKEVGTMISGGPPRPRMVVEYSDKCKMSLNQHCVGAFCYYHKDVLNSVGLMDETYKNAWEHVDHSYSIVKQEWIPAYWWWPDVANSYDYLDEQACSEERAHAVIRNSADWENNINTGAAYFLEKHGTYPGGPQGVPETLQQDVIQRLKNIKQKRSRCMT
jgi:glycosyltransferase involved in cell wall biosynthesis